METDGTVLHTLGQAMGQAQGQGPGICVCAGFLSRGTASLCPEDSAAAFLEWRAVVVPSGLRVADPSASLCG